MFASQSKIIALITILALVTGCKPATNEPTLIPRTSTPESLPQIAAATSSPTPELSKTSVGDIVASLRGLSLEEFFNASYHQLQLRDPDLLTGFPDCYAIRHDQLTNMSDAYLRESQQLEIAILELLHTYDRENLPSDQQLSYDIYEWMLENWVNGQEFLYFDFPINGYGSWDLANRLIEGMLAVPIGNQQDAEDYIARLSQIDTWVDQLLEGLRLREQAGVIPPRFLLADAIAQIEGHMQMQSPGTFNMDAIELYASFVTRLQEAGEISEQDRQILIQAARSEIEQTFIPAFSELRDYLIYLQGIATDDAGLWRLPNGDAYYAHLLRRYTGTDLSVDELHEIGLAQVGRLQNEMQQVAKNLGYPAGLSMAEINQVLDENSSLLEGNALLAEYQRLVSEAEAAAPNFFGLLPTAALVIIVDPSVPIPAYYQAPRMDDSAPGQMIVNLQNPGAFTLYNKTVLTHHETIPGHHMQLAMTLDLDLPTFRTTLCSDVYLKDIEFQGYMEGWAVYAQQLGWEMGLYGGDQMENLGRLRLMLNQVARMVVDTGIHDMGWTREDAAAYFEDATGRPTSARQMNRYVALPGQAVSYDFGYITILNLRQQAMDQLGNQFDIKEFHDVILGNGPMPVGFLPRVVDEWIEAKPSP
jgi:uncharacterized protein (DUF885 family)